ncbi:unnamed protein product [Adineta steineri]|uniref:Uncharacterized protein n=1 Tax=Adineta steineri TaxID=433720 RepID=A0A819JC19_9BILA|nr:unnamed protein product [Adineta steineri]CAF1206979.1 unnamed protein product [Adineta steineri]CAF1483293.1 unnamed protein product [Adineta steineri]CAF3928272.1 unnamed protein product [Adineta steineri]
MFTPQLPLLTPIAGAINTEQPARTKLVGYPGRMMLRDIKRRTLIRKYWPQRFRYQLLRKNMMFPDSFKNYCREEEFSTFTNETQPWWRWNRCALTSRQWGVLEQYRLGRIMWRRFADYNQMSGVMRTTFDRYTRQNTEMMKRDRRIIREDP